MIPLGCAGTCYALYCASQSIKAGDSNTANRMFRYRIYGQAFTLVALVGGSYYYNADRILRREYDKLQTEKKAKEKNEAWIRELEARDRDDKDWRERMGKVRDAQREDAEKRIKAMEDKKSEDGGGGGAITKAVKKLKGESKSDVQRKDREERRQSVDEKTGEDKGGGTIARTVDQLKEEARLAKTNKASNAS